MLANETNNESIDLQMKQSTHGWTSVSHVSVNTVTSFVVIVNNHVNTQNFPLIKKLAPKLKISSSNQPEMWQFN